MQKTTVIVAIFVAALLAGLFMNAMAQVPPAKTSQEGGASVKEKFMQRQVGMPLDMESVEGGPPGVAGFSGVSPILGSEPKPVPLEPYAKADDPELFQFQSNKISAECCPSPFSTDIGCVCMTDAQMKQFASRGGNRA